jgi:hypothetical protein
MIVDESKNGAVSKSMRPHDLPPRRGFPQSTNLIVLDGEVKLKARAPEKRVPLIHAAIAEALRTNSANRRPVRSRHLLVIVGFVGQDEVAKCPALALWGLDARMGRHHLFVPLWG